MLKDFEGNRIYLSENPNGHLLVLGRSGAGKTYFSCRKIEAAIKEGKSLYIFDHSCSYSLIELKKNRFRYADNMNILNPMEKRMEWNFSGKDIQKSLTNSLLRELRIRSYYQKNLLSKAIDNVFHEGDHFSIPQLIKHLNDLRYREEDEESAKNALHLLNHLDPYSEIGEISISQDNEAEKEGTLTLIQLSDYPEIQRKFLTEFLAELFWEEVRHGK